MLVHVTRRASCAVRYAHLRSCFSTARNSAFVARLQRASLPDPACGTRIVGRSPLATHLSPHLTSHILTSLVHPGVISDPLRRRASSRTIRSFWADSHRTSTAVARTLDVPEPQVSKTKGSPTADGYMWLLPHVCFRNAMGGHAAGRFYGPALPLQRITWEARAACCGNFAIEVDMVSAFVSILARTLDVPKSQVPSAFPSKLGPTFGRIRSFLTGGGKSLVRVGVCPMGGRAKWVSMKIAPQGMLAAQIVARCALVTQIWADIGPAGMARRSGSPYGAPEPPRRRKSDVSCVPGAQTDRKSGKRRVWQACRTRAL